MQYQPRVIDGELERRLRSAGAVVIEGPKACGKTASALQIAASDVRFDTDPQARAAVDIDPGLMLAGAQPRLLDEWQMAPALWNHVRRAIDDSGGRSGQYVLTGSATPNDDVAMHSGAGRFSFLPMRSMSLFESGHSSGALSLRSLMEGSRPSADETGATLSDVVDWIIVGGWPGLQNMTTSDAAQANRDYLRQMTEVDVTQVAGGRRDPARVYRLLQSLARNVATDVKRKVLAREAETSEPAIDEYLNVLGRLRIIEDQPAWSPSLKSKARLARGAKRHLVDPSLAVASLAASPAQLTNELEYLGLLFESLVVRDLRVYSQPLDGTVFHYSDNTGLEVDAIVQTPPGWAAFEVKLNPNKIDDAAVALHRMHSKIDTERWGNALCLGVITATGYAYERADGVMVIPIGTLAL